jgi:glycosyltransferase involved in cell wall biosynthesis
LELTFLMPCLNEAETLRGCIEEAKAFLAQHRIEGEVLIADNGSTDGSQELARQGGARVVSVAVRGYGAALYAGAMEAHGRYVIMGDSDGSYDFSSVLPLLESLRAGNDLVMGNRFLGGIQPGAMPWKNRYLGNPVLSGLGRLFFQTPLGDFHCGIRGFSKEAFRRMELRTTGMEFASEMVIKATLLGMKVHQVPTRLRPDGRSRPPHLRPWRDGWRHLRFMLLYSPTWLFLYPGLLLMLAGGVGVAALERGPVFMGRVGFDVHTLLYCAMAVLVGFQAVLFDAFARVFAVVEGLTPQSRGLARAFQLFNLERGLLVGSALIILGLIHGAMAVTQWGRVSFGPLNAQTTLREVIPSVLALTLGVELLFGSFFLSMLGLRVRR